MIKMTDNNVKNEFTIFCDFCNKEILPEQGEVLFFDVINGIPATFDFMHYACSKEFERKSEHFRGNMSISHFIEILSGKYKTKG